MTQTTGMDLVEREYGKPSRQIMIDLYDEHRNVEKCAALPGLREGEYSLGVLDICWSQAIARHARLGRC